MCGGDGVSDDSRFVMRFVTHMLDKHCVKLS